MNGDERHPGEQAEDLRLLARVVGLERCLDLADVAVVLGVLAGVHIDLDHLHLRLRELQPHVLGRLELAVAEDGVAQLVQVLEPDDGPALLDLHRGGHDGLDLDAEVAIDELLGVADAHAPPRLGIDVLDEVVELQRAVLGGRRRQEHHAGPAGALADGRAPEVELPGALAAVAGVAHEAGDAALAVLGQVEVLVVLRLVDDQHVDADVVPGDAGVVLPAFGQLHLLRDPSGDAFAQDRLVTLGELLALGGVATTQRDLALDRLGLFGVGADGLLVHARAAERGVAEQHGVVLAGLEPGPLLGALLRRVRVARREALPFATADRLLLRADNGDPIVGERRGEVVVPLPDDGVGDEHHGAFAPALLTGAREHGEAGVGLADAHVKRQ